MNKQLQEKILFFIMIFFSIFSTFSTVHTKIARKSRTKTIKKKLNTQVKTLPKKASLPYQKPFSMTLSKFIDDAEYISPSNEIIWQDTTPIAFNELILSWNAFRPATGKITFFVSILSNLQWSPWHRIAEWKPKGQQTFVNKKHPFVHTKHVRVEMQRHHTGQGFRIKAVFPDGAQKNNLKALFACVTNSSHFQKTPRVFDEETSCITDIPRVSQMKLAHSRAGDLCSPSSLSMITHYFANKLYPAVRYHNLDDYVVDFAEKVHDNGYLDIYGNWVLNIAEAFNASQGDIFYRIERLNGFASLYQKIKNKIPVAVSVRKLRGGATPYANGHFLIVIGWNNQKKRVICIDPAFSPASKTLRSYTLHDFLRAWELSRNLSYVPLLKESL